MRCKLPSREALITYYDILKDYPADLLESAGREYIKTATYQKFPLVGELTEKIEEELKDRKREIFSLKKTRQWHEEPTIKLY